jgi:hypothetical protein
LAAHWPPHTPLVHVTVAGSKFCSSAKQSCAQSPQWLGEARSPHPLLDASDDEETVLAEVAVDGVPDKPDETVEVPPGDVAVPELDRLVPCDPLETWPPLLLPEVTSPPELLLDEELEGRGHAVRTRATHVNTPA